MKKLLLAILASSLFVLTPTVVHAENSIGFAAGSTRGMGATYWPTDDYKRRRNGVFRRRRIISSA